MKREKCILIIMSSLIKRIVGIAFILVVLFATPTSADTEIKTIIGGETDYLRGDVDRNRTINSKDALEILKYASKHHMPNTVAAGQADLNLDTRVNAEDALLVLKKAVKMIEEFPYSLDCVTVHDEKYSAEEMEIINRMLQNAPELPADCVISKVLLCDLYNDGTTEIILIDCTSSYNTYMLFDNGEYVNMYENCTVMVGDLIYIGDDFFNYVECIALPHQVEGSISETINNIYLK